MPTPAQTLAAEITEKRTKLATYFDKKTDDGRFDWTAEDRDAVKTLNDELNTITPKWEAAHEAEAIERKNREQLDRLKTLNVPANLFAGRVRGGDGASLAETVAKSVGRQFVESKAFTDFKTGFRGPTVLDDFEVKTLFQRTDGFDPFVQRSDKVVYSPQQMPKVVDLLPTTETNQQSVKWMLETIYTNAAAATAEAGTFAEAAVKFVEQLSAVQKIAVFIPVTDEQMEDEPRVRSILDNRLDLMIRQKLDSHLIAGTGVAPQLRGLTSLANKQTQAKGADAIPTSIYKAMTKIRVVAFAEPTGVILHPNDWQRVKLLQTADGLYIWGHPSADSPDRIWGLPVVQTTFETEGKGHVADFLAHTELVYRRGVEFLVSNSHADYFIKGQQAIRASLRAAFLVTREEAVCELTGLNA